MTIIIIIILIVRQVTRPVINLDMAGPHQGLIFSLIISFFFSWNIRILSDTFQVSGLIMLPCKNISYNYIPMGPSLLITDKNDPRVKLKFCWQASFLSSHGDILPFSPLLFSPCDNLHDKACWMIGYVWQSHSSSLISQSLPACDHDPVLAWLLAGVTTTHF